MPGTDPRETVLGIVNEVQRRLGLNVTSTLTATKSSTRLMQHVNNVLDELSDLGEWEELYELVTVNVSASVFSYSVAASAAPVHNIYDIGYSGRTAPLLQVEKTQMLQLRRLANVGQPSQFCVMRTDTSANPVINIWPTPTTAAASGASMSVSVYTKPIVYTSANASTIVPLPARCVIQGVYAHAILDEDGGSPTPRYQTEFQLFQNMAQNALNRFNSDTGTSISFQPNTRGHR